MVTYQVKENSLSAEPVPVAQLLEHSDALKSADLPVFAIKPGCVQHHAITGVLSETLSRSALSDHKNPVLEKRHKYLSVIVRNTLTSDIQIVGGQAPRLFTEFRDTAAPGMWIQDFANQFRAMRRDLENDLAKRILLMESVQSMKSENLLGDALLSFILHNLLDIEEKTEQNVALFGVNWGTFKKVGTVIFDKFASSVAKARALEQLSLPHPGIYDQELLKIGLFRLPKLVVVAFPALQEILQQNGPVLMIDDIENSQQVTVNSVLIVRTQPWFDPCSNSPSALLRTAIRAYEVTNPVLVARKV